MVMHVARDYAARGWHLVRIAPLSKTPVSAAWQKSSASPEDFARGDNVGVALGSRSGDLVDVDLDCPEAVALAPRFLPPTATFGRASKPQSHWLYLASIPRTRKPANAHIEIRSTGGQTVMPGSIHETGESIEWHDTTTPITRLPPDALIAAWCKLGVAVLLARSLAKLAPSPGQGGGVHDLCLAISGSLKRAGWPLDAVLYLVEHALGPGPAHRLEAVHATYGREEGDPVTGWPTLERLLGHRETAELKRFAEDPAHGFVRLADQTLAQVAHPLNDLGNARRLIDRNGQDLRYVAGVGWLRWSSTHWAPIDDPYPEAQAVIDELAVCPLEGTAGTRLRKFAERAGSAGALASIIRLASHQPEIRLEASTLDADPYTLATPAGILDLRTADLRTATRADLVTRLTPVAPDPEHPTPRWDRFLEETHPDPEHRAYLLRFLGYCLTADTSEHAFGLWWGPAGRNGKGVLLRLLAAVLGEHACDVAPDTLFRGRNAHPTGLLDFRGRRLMILPETDDHGRAWDEQIVKTLTGGDTIRARGMGRDFVSFRPTHKLIVACNERPVFRGTGVFLSRVHLLPWPISFLGREDRSLEAELAAEAPGILAQLAVHAREWIDQRLVVPASMCTALADYRASQDVYGQFLEEVAELAPEDKISRTALYQAYSRWCDSAGETRDSASVFYRKVSARGFGACVTNGVREIRGLRFKKKSLASVASMG